MPVLHASVAKKKGLLQSGVANIGASSNALLRVVQARCCSSPQLKFFLTSDDRLVYGDERSEVVLLGLGSVLCLLHMAWANSLYLVVFFDRSVILPV